MMEFFISLLTKFSQYASINFVRTFLFPKINNVGVGALRGLIGKTGVMPARSRHCNGERTQVYATGTKVLGRFGRVMIQSQENCLFKNHRVTHERWGGDYVQSVLFLPGCQQLGFLLTFSSVQLTTSSIGRSYLFGRLSC